MCQLKKLLAKNSRWQFIPQQQSFLTGRKEKRKFVCSALLIFAAVARPPLLSTRDSQPIQGASLVVPAKDE